MNTREIANYSRMKGILDDNYSLYENGEVINIYDANIYPGNQDLKRILKASELKQEIKEKLLENADEADKDLVKTLVGL